MPAASQAARVLVTGASGFLATHLSRTLLQRGHSVIGTVRSSLKGRFLQNLHQSDRFSYHVVEDIAKPGAIDNILQGVDCVQHTASPFHFNAEDPDDIIQPAVRGTLGVLESVQKHGVDVRRIVITSSTAAVISPKESPHVFNETDWNDQSPSEVERLGVKASGSDKYQASKALAERAAWDKYRTCKELNRDLRWDLVTICPPFIFGPVIQEVTDVSRLNTSSAFFRSWISELPPKEQVVGPFLNLVDVRDVALAHVLAMESENAGGERFIVSNGPFCVQDIYDDLNASGSRSVPRGWPGEQTPAHLQDVHDGSKAVRLLGLKMTSRKSTVADTFDSLEERFGSA